MREDLHRWSVRVGYEGLVVAAAFGLLVVSLLSFGFGLAVLDTALGSLVVVTLWLLALAVLAGAVGLSGVLLGALIGRSFPDREAEATTWSRLRAQLDRDAAERWHDDALAARLPGDVAGAWWYPHLLRAFEFLAGATAGVAVVAWAHGWLAVGIAFVVLVAVAAGAVVLWLAFRHVVLAESLVGLALAVYANWGLLLVSGEVYVPSADTLVTVVLAPLVLLYSPVVALRVVRAAGWRLDWRLAAPFAVAVLLVVAGAPVADQRAPEPTTSLAVSEELDLAERHTVLLWGNDYLPESELVEVGELRLSNPARFPQEAYLPGVRACLFAPERHELVVRQGRMRGDDHVPAAETSVLGAGETRATTLRLDVGDLDDATLDELGTVPVTVAESCPDQSDQPRLVVYTTSEYVPMGTLDQSEWGQPSGVDDERSGGG